MLFILCIITLFLLVILYYSSAKGTILRNGYNGKLLYFGAIIVSFYIVCITDINYEDRIAYNSRFNYISEQSLFQSFDNLRYEPLFIVTVKLISYFANTSMDFYMLLHLLFLIILLKGLNILVGKDYGLLVFLIFLNYPFFYGYTLNGIRQGFALAMIILSIGYMIKKYNKRFLLFSFLAVMFHYGSIPFSTALLVLNYFKRIKIPFLLTIYGVLSLLFVFGLQPMLLSFVDIGTFENYFSQETIKNFGGSNKIDFLIYNTIFLFIFLYFKSKFRDDDLYLNLLKVYLSFSCIFLLFGFMAYANRVASYSWFIIPLITGYIIYNIKSDSIRLILILIICIVGLSFSIPSHAFK